MPIHVVTPPEPVGDAAVAVRIAGATAGETLGRVRDASEAVRAAAIPGVTDVVASPGRVTVAYEPLVVADLDAFQEQVAAVVAAAATAAGGGPVRHEIPVAYDGPDLAEVCAGHGISQERFVAVHTEADYLVEAIGFLPGFGYLAGLPAGLATPRRATPRRVVPAGAVGIGGGQTGVYPFASPGGWNLVGRSDVRLFDAARLRPALFSIGDRVRFVAADVPPAGEPIRSVAAVAMRTPAALTVVQPGLFTTIQDLGRPGHRSAGVPLSGAADPVSLRLANLLVGNREDAAALECTLLGPTLRFESDSVMALVGGDFPGWPGNAATRVPAGTVITLGHATAGCRGYLAVAGGFVVEPVLGSRSTLVAAGLGGFAGRPLRAGDRLAVGEAGQRSVDRKVAAPASGEPGVLRIIPGAQAEAFGAEAWYRTFRTSSRSDRMGVRLEGNPLGVGSPLRGAGALAGLASVAVFPGTVQVPPDGQPIVLLADAQTMGGYPVLGQVIRADLPRAAQLRPGDHVRLEPVTLAEAHAALRHQEAAIREVREAVR
jgi:antagonist of KipI